MAQFLRSSGAMDLSLAASAGEMWEADRSVQVGDVLTLAVDCPHVTDSSAYYTQTVREVTVGAIIRYFSGSGRLALCRRPPEPRGDRQLQAPLQPVQRRLQNHDL